MADTHNPLLQEFTTPHGVPPFHLIKTEHFLPAVKKAIQEAEADIEAIKSNPEEPSFENTIEALEFAGTTLNRVGAIFSNIAGAHADDEIRALEEEVDRLFTQYSNKISMDLALFERIKDVYDAREHLDLNADQAMLLENAYKGFVRSGALLNDADKEKLKKINERLSELGTQFSQNTVKSTAAYKKVITDESQLAGLPERAKKLYRATAEKEGVEGWMIKLSPPPMDIFSHAENRELRKEIQLAWSNIAEEGEFSNKDIVLEIVRLKHERAQLLGYKTHAEFVLEERMAKTPETVMEFLETNKAAYKPAAEAFLAELKAYAAKTDGLHDFKPWDLSYYSRKLKEEKFELDMETLRPYFSVEKVLEGVKNHAEKLFNITLTEDTGGKYPVKSPDIKVYEVTDRETGEMIGIFYADYFARPGAKHNGAWMSAFRSRGDENGENKFAIIANTCNFDEPAKDQPSLLSLDDVTTVFHEFGHGLHGLLAEGKYPSLNGTSVKWDYVELPSQLQENWVKEKELLDTFAHHYQTGEKLSDAIIEKIQAMEQFGTAYAGLRQTFFGLLDMKWHNTDPAELTSVEAVEDSVAAEASLFPRYGGTQTSAFGHLFAGGYSAGYYGYKWAEVLDADVFELFKEKGLYHQEHAKRLRSTIYSQGGRKDPMALYIDMMGREPNPEALFRREGIAGNTAGKKPKPEAPGA